MTLLSSQPQLLAFPQDVSHASQTDDGHSRSGSPINVVVMTLSPCQSLPVLSAFTFTSLGVANASESQLHSRTIIRKLRVYIYVG